MKQTITLYPLVCERLNHTVATCLRSEDDIHPSVVNNDAAINNTQHHHRHPIIHSVQRRRLKRTLEPRLRSLYSLCQVGITALSRWRVERCVVQASATGATGATTTSDDATTDATTTPDNHTCTMVLNCFLSPKEQRRFGTWAPDQQQQQNRTTMNHGGSGSGSGSGSDSDSDSNQDSDSDDSPRNGLKFTNYTTIGVREFGVGMLWATVLGEALQERVTRMEWTYFGVQTGVGFAWASVLMYACLPCFLIMCPLAMAAQLLLYAVSMATANLLYPQASIRQAQANQTTVVDIFT